MSSGALDRLANRLKPFGAGIAASPAWRDAQGMATALRAVQSHHKRAHQAHDRERILDTVARYLHTGQVARPEILFDLCQGAGWVDDEGMGVLADRQLRRRLFEMAATTTGRAKRLKAFRNLLHAYWSFPLHEDATPRAAVEGWRELRGWLRGRHAEIGSLPSRKPTWFAMLAHYPHLLDENPCAPYAKALLRGNLDELQQAIDALFIPADSWLKTEAVMAQVGAACERPDTAFRALLPGLMKVATGAAGIRVTPTVTRRAIARLVMRFARNAEYAPHETLFNLALDAIGNPWRERAQWDAHVCDDNGAPCALAHAMINVWLKERMIGEFFQDGGHKESRAEFWQRYSVLMQALSTAVAGNGDGDAALLARMSELLVVIPRRREHQIEAYAWSAVAAKGGARLMSADQADSAALRDIQGQCAPEFRLSQFDRAAGEHALRNLFFRFRDSPRHA